MLFHTAGSSVSERGVEIWIPLNGGYRAAARMGEEKDLSGSRQRDAALSTNAEGSPPALRREVRCTDARANRLAVDRSRTLCRQFNRRRVDDWRRRIDYAACPRASHHQFHAHWLGRVDDAAALNRRTRGGSARGNLAAIRHRVLRSADARRRCSVRKNLRQKLAERRWITQPETRMRRSTANFNRDKAWALDFQHAFIRLIVAGA